MAGIRTKRKGKNSEMLARRRAALERAAERMAEQRRVAEEAEAERLRKEAAFDELAADFELAVEDERLVAAEVEEEVRRVRERGQVRIDEARVVAARVVVAMGKAGETVAGCGRRLGVGAERVKELRRLGREDSAGEGSSETAPERLKAGPPAKAMVPEKATAGGPGGEQPRGGGRASGQAGAARVAAPLVTAPAAPPVPLATPAAPPRAVTSASSPAGPSGGVGGARAGWPESSR
ncbi:hypothetical protein ACFYY1_41865 [Streptomyces sp. NPDC001890]|uniref:hypothetical protein n=1 Tax=Streptomyces sp. NPDC001890 TaxID=3364620 RepID=UPI0036C5CC06